MDGVAADPISGERGHRIFIGAWNMNRKKWFYRIEHVVKYRAKGRGPMRHYPRARIFSPWPWE